MAVTAQDTDLNVTEASSDVELPVSNMIDETVIATFPGPLDSYSIDLTILNNTSGELTSFTLDGQREVDPITWDDMGSFSGPATLEALEGVDTEVVVATFSGFESGEAIGFSGIDPDFTGDPSSGVTVGDLAGILSEVVTTVGPGEAIYEIVGNDVVATIVVGAVPAQETSWGRVKSRYR
jgi:hypothetical protein